MKRPGRTARPVDTRLGIWPENWPAVRLFVALSTQWRRAGMTGARTGLDYAAIAPTAALTGIETDPETMQRLQFMEGEVLRIDARKRDAERRPGRDR